jgi:hypothetical protein
MPTAFKASLLPFGLLATDELLRKYELHPGDELFCLGYPLFTSADHGFPILRSGKIASYPLVPAKQHKNWLFDFRVFKGKAVDPSILWTAIGYMATRRILAKPSN